MDLIIDDSDTEGASIAGLRSTESVLRDRLRHDPVHNETRIRLAWCLFAIAGWEANHWTCFQVATLGGLPESARVSLEEAVRHANVVKQLSRNAGEHSEVELLRSMAEMVGGMGLVRAVDREVSSRVNALSRELRTKRRARGGGLRGRQSRRALVRHGRSE